MVTRVIERLPSPAEYRALRSSVGWRVPDVEVTERALQASRGGVVAVDHASVVGMGRLVGDGSLYLVVVDLVVRSGHQGRGVGTALLGSLERIAAAMSATGVVQLVAEPDVFPFYERHGYRAGPDAVLSKRLP